MCGVMLMTVVNMLAFHNSNLCWCEKKRSVRTARVAAFSPGCRSIKELLSCSTDVVPSAEPTATSPPLSCTRSDVSAQSATWRATSACHVTCRHVAHFCVSVRIRCWVLSLTSRARHLTLDGWNEVVAFLLISPRWLEKRCP